MTTPSSSEGLVETVHGRLRQASDKDYYLPADGDEHARLDMQHLALKLTMDSLYSQRDLVMKTLARTEKRPKVLDVGTGSGIWAIEMAREYPNAEVLGIDIVQPSLLQRPGVAIPPNCTLKVADGTREIKQFHKEFDVIHFRAAHLGMPDFANILLEDVANALEPNGVLLLVHCVPVLLRNDLSAYPVTHEGQFGFSYFQRAFYRICQAHFKKARVKVEPSIFWHNWLEESSSFQSVVTEEVLVPIGRNVETTSPTEKHVRDLYSTNVANVIAAFRPLLLEDGLDDDTIESWVQGVRDEFGEEGAVVGYMAWRYTTAIRTVEPVKPLETALEGDISRQAYDLYLAREAGDPIPM